MDNQKTERGDRLSITAISETGQNRLSDLAHDTSVKIVRAIGEIRLRESDSYIQTALALIDSRDKDRNPYIFLIINEGMRLAKEQWSKPWAPSEMVPVERPPHWDPSGTLNETMTFQQKNEMVTPTPRLLNDVMMPRSTSSIRLAEAALRPKKKLQARLDALLGKPQPTQDDVMAQVVKAYAYDMSIYFRREMQKPPEKTSLVSSPESQADAYQTLTTIGRGPEVRV